MLPTSLLRRLDLRRSRADGSGQVKDVVADGPAFPRQEESAHRLANLLQFVVCNLERAERAATGTAELGIGHAKRQVVAACCLQDVLDRRSDGERPVAGYFRSVGDMLDALMVRPGGHSFAVEVEIAAENAFLPGRALSDLGRIVVEAVMNAAKHAFPAGPGGTVVLRLSRAGAWLSCVIMTGWQPRRAGAICEG